MSFPNRKCLYVKSHKPDNWTDDSFLDELRKNMNMKRYTYLELVLQTALIGQQLSLLFLFCSAFYFTFAKIIPTGWLLACDLSILVFILIVNLFSNFGVLSLFPKVLIFALILAGLSPILKTLTEDTSSDTIWALSFMLFVANCIFQKYNESNPGPIALNAAIFASVLLASRLDSTVQVFGLIALAVLLFSSMPAVRYSAWKRSKFWHAIFSTALLFLSFAVSSWINWAYFLCNVMFNLFVVFVCPFWFIQLYRFKYKINGPWDEAKLQLS